MTISKCAGKRLLFLALPLLMSACAQHSSNTNGTKSQHGTAKTVKLKPEEVPVLFAAPAESDARCAQITEEIAKLDAGLGGTALEKPPTPPITAMGRVTSFGKNMAVETVKGAVQPVIQTKRALMNDDAKERARAEALERGNIRRAYLKGLFEGIPCQAAATAATAATATAAPAPASTPVPAPATVPASTPVPAAQVK